MTDTKTGMMIGIGFPYNTGLDAIDLVLGGLVGCVVKITLKTGEVIRNAEVTSFGEYMEGGTVLNYTLLDYMTLALDSSKSHYGQADFADIESIVHY